MNALDVPHRLLLEQITAQQDHVMASVEGLDAQDLQRPVAPSGWSAVSLLGHLTFDDEIFWVHAILCGEQDGIDQVRDGWREVPDDPHDAVDRYRSASLRTRDLLQGADLDGPPRWWPSHEVFPFPPFGTGWECAFRLLSETSVHAGHLDLCRELIDGHQHLVVTG